MGGGVDGGTADHCKKCGSKCVDIATDRAHCGECYQACADQYVCESGRCTLGGGLAFDEIYRTGVTGSLGSPVLFAVVGNVLHFHPGNLQPFVCDKTKCGATATPRPSLGPGSVIDVSGPFTNTIFPTRSTPRGFFSGGNYYSDAELTMPIADARPTAAPQGMPYGLSESGSLFYGCATKQACPPPDGSTRAYSLFRCALGQCQDFASATALRNISCKVGSGYDPVGSCLPFVHVLRTSPGKEWVLLDTSSGGWVCPLAEAATCGTMGASANLRSRAGELKISGDVMIWPEPSPTAPLGILTPETSLEPRMVNPGDPLAYIVSAGESRRFLVRTTTAVWGILSFDAEYKPTLRRMSFELPPPKLGSELTVGYGNFIADDTYVYGIRTERNDQGDQNVVILRAAY
jgi:hypothetical protein